MFYNRHTTNLSQTSYIEFAISTALSKTLSSSSSDFKDTAFNTLRIIGMVSFTC